MSPTVGPEDAPFARSPVQCRASCGPGERHPEGALHVLGWSVPIPSTTHRPGLRPAALGVCGFVRPTGVCSDDQETSCSWERGYCAARLPVAAEERRPSLTAV